MRSSISLLLVLQAIALITCCAPTHGDQIHIDKQIRLSPGHRVTPYKIIRLQNDDLVVLGSNDQLRNTAWATLLSSSGEVKWEFFDRGSDSTNDRGFTDGQFLDVLEAPDGSLVFCGTRDVKKNSAVVLTKVSREGKLISEKLPPPARENSVIRLSGCYAASEGITLIGAASGQPQGTGWMSVLSWDFESQSTRFSDNYGESDFIDVNGSLTTFSWEDKNNYIVEIAKSGEVTAKQSVKEGESHLVHGISIAPLVQVVTVVGRNETIVSSFDNQLHDLQRPLTLHNVGVKKALALPDGTIVIFGSRYTDSAVAAVTRVYPDGRQANTLIVPKLDSFSYLDAVLNRAGDVVVAVRQLGAREGVAEFLSFK